MVLWDPAIVSTALRLNAGLRGNLHSLVRRLSENASTDNELDRIEQEVVRSIKVWEARRLPDSVPGEGEPLALNSEQLGIVMAIISRFGDHQLRGKCELLISRAIAAGDIVGV